MVSSQPPDRAASNKEDGLDEARAEALSAYVAWLECRPLAQRSRQAYGHQVRRYTEHVLDELRACGELITTSEIERISPLAHQHIHLYGHYPFDIATRAPPATGPSGPRRRPRHRRP